MFGKNRNKKVGLCVMVVTASLVLAGLWAVLATPETALAKKPDKPPGQDKPDKPGGGGGKYLYLDVFFDDDGLDRVKSDGLGTYSHGKDKVIALAYKRFRLDTTKKGGKRTVTLDLSDFVESPFGQNPIVVAVDMRLGFKYMEDEAGDFLEELDVTGMSEGDDNAIKATMSIHFSYNGELYGLAFGTIAQWIDEISVGTDPVTLTRTGPDTWTIEATSYDQAALYLLDWKNGIHRYGGDIMPFEVTLEVQP